MVKQAELNTIKRMEENFAEKEKENEAQLKKVTETMQLPVKAIRIPPALKARNMAIRNGKHTVEDELAAKAKLTKNPVELMTSPVNLKPLVPSNIKLDETV